ncbi:MAG TPA: hypothetical protein DF296_00650 [Candidatus Margulisbacteria bacterium]|nr:MAG: hypothetical protein A2X09_17480 [Bacteroidetes bacterium GWF2_43_11]OGI11311.1 MAG: hypothetical protein A2X41_04295 [Candidatus Margulisbacteria bacterium GWE2_39_32]HCT83692.1 hypothetical protein [Candidatus Margulisiibacteriota bacterium]
MFMYIFKNILQRKRKYILSILIISVVVLLVIVMNSLSIAYKNTASLPFKNIQSSIIIQRSGNVPEVTKGAILPCSLVAISSDYLKEVRSIGEVKGISTGLLLWVFDEAQFKRVMGVDWTSTLGTRMKAGISSGRYPQSNREVVVEKTFANQHGLLINQKVTISGELYKITGIVQLAGKNVVSSDYYTNLQAAQEIAYNSKVLQNTEKFNKDDIGIIFLDVEQTDVTTVSLKLKKIFATSGSTGATPTGQTIGSFTITTPQSFEKQISSFFFLSDKLLLLILGTIIISSVLIIISSLSHNVLERRRELGIMRAVGYTAMDIKKIIISETFLLLIIGFVIGIVSSIVAIFALSKTHIAITIPWELNPYPHFLLSEPTRADTVQNYLLPIQFQMTYAFISALIIIGTGCLTIALILRNINKYKVTEVLRHE